MSEVNYNQELQQIQIASKIFADDLENAIKGLKVEDVLSDESSVLLENYILKNTSIQVNQKDVQINFLGYEIEDDVVWCYMVVNDVKKMKNVKFSFTWLLDELPDQLNVIQWENGDDEKTLFIKSEERSQFLEVD